MSGAPPPLAPDRSGMCAVAGGLPPRAVEGETWGWSWGGGGFAVAWWSWLASWRSCSDSRPLVPEWKHSSGSGSRPRRRVAGGRRGSARSISLRDAASTSIASWLLTDFGGMSKSRRPRSRRTYPGAVFSVAQRRFTFRERPSAFRARFGSTFNPPAGRLMPSTVACV